MGNFIRLFGILFLFFSIVGGIVIHRTKTKEAVSKRKGHSQPQIISEDRQNQNEVDENVKRAQFRQSDQSLRVRLKTVKVRNSGVIDAERAEISKRLDQTLQSQDPQKRRQELAEIAEFLVDTNRVDRFFEIASNLESSSDTIILLSTIIQKLMDQDHHEAALWLNEFDESWNAVNKTKFANILTPVILEISRDDMDSAYDLIDSLDDVNTRESVLTGAMQLLIKNDIQKAKDWIENFPAGDHRDKTLFKLGFQWSQMDTKSAAQWIEGLPEDNGKDRAIEGLVNIWISKDPHAAANWAIQLKDPYTRDIAVSNIIDVWTYRDPKLVLEWVITFPSGELRMESFKKTIDLWAQYHPESAEEWLESIDDEEFRRVGLGILTH